MNLAKLWAITQAERRIITSQLMYWLFVLVAYVDAIGIFVVQGMAHAYFSPISGTMDYPAPRNAIFYIAHYYLIIFIMAVVFLSLDVRARDTRVRILEILDSRPYSNLDLVFGRFLGWFLCAWTPIILLMFIIPALGAVLPMIHIAAGGAVEPLALFGFAFYMALPALAFTCSLVMLLTLLVNHRIGALVLSVVIIGGAYYTLAFQPFSLALTFDLMGTLQVNQASEWIPSIAKSHWWLQRAGLLVLAIGFVLFSVTIHPRLDRNNRRWQALAASIVSAIGIALIVTAYSAQNDNFQLQEDWRLAHQEKSGQAFPDVISMDAEVEIDPGNSLSVDLELVFEAPADREITTAVFSLNPGFEIQQFNNEQGASLDSRFQDGLLEIDLAAQPLQPGQQRSVHLRYTGTPDLSFAYLDSAIDIATTPVTIDSRSIISLDNAIFDENYVALMPGIHWLPTSGVDVGRDNGEMRPRDFYSIHLQLKLPEGWTAAGPGKREELSRNTEQVVYQYSPASVVPEVALLAASFTSYSTQIEGIEFELLLHPNHTKVIDAMRDAKSEIEDWIADRLTLVQDVGLSYPFRTFTLVEVPNTLRGFEGGWKMGTALAPPSMVLLREKGLPTARFDVPVESFDNFVIGGPARITGDDPAIVARDTLIQFFSNDFSGGNLFSGFARSFFDHQTAATGPGAIALDFALKELATLVVSGERSYFSAERALTLDDSLNDILFQDWEQHKSTTEKVIESFTSSPDVWEAALAKPLDQIDPWEDPALTTDVLSLKSGKLAEAIYDSLGPQQSGQLLAELLERHRGSTYSIADLTITPTATEQELSPLFKSWLTDTGLAGFVSDRVELSQLPENENGETRYQLSMRLNNPEPVTGISRFSWSTDVEGDRSFSSPVSIPGNSAVEFSLVLSEPPVAAYIDPYLSLNREDYQVQSFSTTDIPSNDKPAFDGVRPTELVRVSEDRIIVDDLDPGFSIGGERFEQQTGVLTALFEPEQEILDQGLPTRELGISSRWSRRVVESAYGKYRHTIAYVGRSDRQNQAIFSASLPRSGRWRLELHQPENFFRFNYANLRGTVNLKIISGNKTEEISWDSLAGVPGWNIIGDYDLDAGDIAVEFSNQSDGRVVIADAISWSPVD